MSTGFVGILPMSAATGRRGSLDRSRILAAALAIIDRDGFDALTMRALASELGVAPMAAYRHFENKGRLVDALLDEVAAGLPIPPPGRSWRDTATEAATGVRDSLLQHPGLVEAVVARPSLGRSAVLLTEAVYAPLRAAGFDDRTVEHAANLVFMYVLGFVAFEAPRRLAAVSVDPAVHVDQDSLAEIYGRIDPAEIPNTVAIGPTPELFIADEQFVWGLEAILDGIARRG